MAKSLSDAFKDTGEAGPVGTPGFRLWRGFLVWQRSLSAALLPLGLTQPLFSILAVTGWLTRAGGAVSQQRIADVAGMDRMHISKTVRRLAEIGLVTRGASKRDRRAVAIRLTEEGRELLARALRVAADHHAAFFAETPGLAPRR